MKEFFNVMKGAVIKDTWVSAKLIDFVWFEFDFTCHSSVVHSFTNPKITQKPKHYQLVPISTCLLVGPSVNLFLKEDRYI